MNVENAIDQIYYAKFLIQERQADARNRLQFSSVSVGVITMNHDESRFVIFSAKAISVDLRSLRLKVHFKAKVKKIKYIVSVNNRNCMKVLMRTSQISGYFISKFPTKFCCFTMFTNLQKRLRLSVEVVKSVDPFESIRSHCSELILQHFSSQELLKLFLVSKQWNRTLSNSKKCMEKLKFGFSQIPWTNVWNEKTLEMLNTSRRYRHVNGHFVYTTVAVKILKLLESSTMSPVVLDVRIDNENGFYGRAPLPDTFNFPQIESLNVQNVLSSALKIKLISSTSRLRKLSVDSIMSAGLVKCLINLKNLKDLQLHGHKEYIFKQPTLQHAKFSLKSLKFTDSSKLSEEARINYGEFLKKMSNTLISLHLDFIYQYDIELVLNNLPNLRVLTVRTNKEDLSRLQLTQNRNIKEFVIFELSDVFKKIILNLRNLEVLHIEIFTAADFKWIVQNSRKLKMCSYRFLKVPSCEQVNCCFIF